MDPEDGEEYLYTNFEPYEAHRLFPCFDQPDIKATYELSVTAPAEWEIIANAPPGQRGHRQQTAGARHKFETHEAVQHLPVRARSPGRTTSVRDEHQRHRARALLPQVDA